MSDTAFLRADAVTKAFKVQRKGEGLAGLYITHDLGVAR